MKHWLNICKKCGIVMKTAEAEKGDFCKECKEHEEKFRALFKEEEKNG